MENAMLAEEYGTCHRSSAFGRYVEVVVLVLLRLLDQSIDRQYQHSVPERSFEDEGLQYRQQ
jgi:hypothetical protein